VETCPHYLLFQADSIPEGQTKYKCAPPIRDGENRKGLLQAVADGNIDLIASDHSPAPPDMKELESGNFLKAWGGISGKGQGGARLAAVLQLKPGVGYLVRWVSTKKS
jgi:dihydroorotase-like cyclic amidohydrolase